MKPISFHEISNFDFRPALEVGLPFLSLFFVIAGIASLFDQKNHSEGFSCFGSCILAAVIMFFWLWIKP